MVINNYITADPNICHGKPVIKGTRIMVWQILEILSLGEGLNQIKTAFPKINSKHIKACLEYATVLTGKGQSSNARQDQTSSLPA